MDANKALFIGCGRLGKCFLELYTKKKIFEEIIVIQPSLSASKDFQEHKFYSSLKNLPSDFYPDVVFLLVKPKEIPAVLKQLTSLPKEALIISCAANVPVASMHTHLPKHKIIRVMPNTGVQVEKSLTLAYAEENLESEKKLVEEIFSHSGGIFWLEQEELIEKLTPLTGSGPALYFALTLAIEKKIIEYKIEQKDARKLAISVLNASSLLAKDPHLEGLIDSICSKGGVTEALLSIFNPLLSQAMDKAIQHCEKKRKEALT